MLPLVAMQDQDFSPDSSHGRIMDWSGCHRGPSSSMTKTPTWPPILGVCMAFEVGETKPTQEHQKVCPWDFESIYSQFQLLKLLKSSKALPRELGNTNSPQTNIPFCVWAALFLGHVLYQFRKKMS